MNDKYSATLTSWNSSDLTTPEVDRHIQDSLGVIDVNLESSVLRKFCQALQWAKSGLGQYRLIEKHPNLPPWWAEGDNKLFIPTDAPTDAIPSINSHPGIPAPKNCTIFLNGRSDYSMLLWGTDCLIYIAPSARIPSAHLAVGDGFSFIGPTVRSTARLNINCRNRGSIILTSDILIASDVKLLSDDCHTIISLDSNTRLNPFGGTIVVKEHVWLGENVIISGDTYISENSVVGARSFVRGVLTPPNTIVAGVPPKVTRSGITWDSRDLPPSHPDLGI